MHKIYTLLNLTRCSRVEESSNIMLETPIAVKIQVPICHRNIRSAMAPCPFIVDAYSPYNDTSLASRRTRGPSGTCQLGLSEEFM